MKLNISGFNHSSIVDGDGLRYVVYTQGCKHKCKGCHNKETWSTKDNQIWEIDDIINKIEEESLSKNVTISGGDPLLQYESIIELCKKLKDKDYNIWLYTGYSIEDISDNEKLRPIITHIDVLVDGKFEEDNKDYSLNYRGSKNQRIIILKPRS